MELQKQVVSLDLAKRLKELGVEQGGSYFYWSYWVDHPAAENSDCHRPHWQLTNQDGGNPGGCDAFTVAELGQLIADNNFPVMGGRNRNGVGDGQWWCCEHRADTEADARAMVLIQILESGRPSSQTEPEART